VPLRVLHVCESTVGGIGNVLLDLVSAQRGRGWSVTVAAPPDPRLAAAGAEVRAWDPGPRPGPGLPAALRGVRDAVRAADPDVVHLHSSMAGLCGRLAVRGRRPTVLQPHSWSFWAREGAVARAALTWERAGARWTDLVLCVSEDERRAGQAAGIATRYAVVPNGVDLARFAPAGDDERQRARAALGLGGGPLAVCVGRLHRQKGQHLLLDAWPAVRTAVPGAVLALVGEGPDRSGLEARAGADVLLPGAARDVRQWLAAADVVVQPSVWEGMALSVLEAMASGRSVVATDVSGMREVLADGAGVLVPREAPALAAAVAARLRDPSLAAGEGRRGRELAVARHDLRRALDGALDVVQAVAERRA
jgi:glycosyltransferase involved in cell wall biosynthesis